MASTCTQMLRPGVRWFRPRLGEVGKLATFFVCYLIYAWRTFHAEVCGHGASCAYPCPPAPLRLRLLHHVKQPGDLVSVVFLQPRDPADRHDGLSCATFLLGGILALALGPASGHARRSCNWRLAWLLLCVLLPKGFLIRYGLFYPSASLGSAVNTMLPRHTALMVWLSIAFPVAWRRQALLAAVYVCHMLAVIRLAATRTTRPWPYSDPLHAPAAVAARLVVLSGLSVAVAAAWDWRRARSSSSSSKGTQAAAAKDGESAPERPSHGAVRTEAARRLGNLRQRRAAANFAAAASGDGAAAAPDCFHSVRHNAESSAVGASPGAQEPGSLSKPSASSARPGCTVTDGAVGAGYESVAPFPTNSSPLLDQLTEPAPAAAEPPRSADAAAATAAGSTAAVASAPVGWQASRYRLPPPQRYRSVTRPTRMYVKMGGVSPQQLDPDAVAALSGDLSARGFLLSDIAVRSGCIEVVLELQDVGGGGGDAAATGDGAVRSGLVRRVVAALAAATGGAAAAAATFGRPVHAHMGGVSYLLSHDAGGAGGVIRAGVAAAAPSDGWHIWEAEAGGGAGGGCGCDGCGDGTGSRGDGTNGTDKHDSTDDDRGLEESRLPSAGQRDQGLLPTVGNGAGAGADPEPVPLAGAAGNNAPCPSVDDPPLLAAALPPCVALPTPFVADSGSTAVAGVLSLVAAAGGSAGEMGFTLLISAPPNNGSGASGGSSSSSPAAATTGSAPAVAAAGAGSAPAPATAAAAAPVPEVLAWQCGCFLKVLGVEEEEADAGELATGPGVSSSAPRLLRSYRVRLDAREVCPGLVTFSIRGAAFAACTAAPLLGPMAHVLVLPPALAVVAEELRQPLAEEAITALAESDAEGVASVSEFLTDLAAWLPPPAALPPPPALHPLTDWVDAGGVADATASALAGAPPPTPGGGGDTAVSSAACTAAWGFSEASLGPSEWDSEARQRASLRALAAAAARWAGTDPMGHPCGYDDDELDEAWERTTVPWDCSMPASSHHVPGGWPSNDDHGVRASGGVARRCFGASRGVVVRGSTSALGNGSGGAPTGMRVVRSWGSLFCGQLLAGLASTEEAGVFAGPIAAEGLDAAAAAAVGSVVAPAAANPLPAVPGRGGPRVLSGGRLDLRTVIADAAAACMEQCTTGAARGGGAAAAWRRARDERQWLLLEHVVQRGWPAATRLLLGLALPSDGDSDANGGTWQLGSLGHPPQRGGVAAAADDGDGDSSGDDGGGGDREGVASMLHLAVGSGVPAVVDAVVAASQRYGTHSHPCGVYGTWMTTMVTEVAEAATPLDVAAALPDGGAMLSYILRRFPEAAAATQNGLAATVNDGGSDGDAASSAGG